MRTWLYNRIRYCYGLPTNYAQNVITTSGSDPTNPVEPKPGTKQFLLFAMGVEQPFLGMPAEARAANVPFTVYVYDDPGSMLKIDEACLALKSQIPTRDGVKVGGLSVLSLDWTGTSVDSFDDHYKLPVRSVTFNAVVRSPEPPSPM